jgi:type II secretory ATPase GspE/PulE/Tfp pilus assembly ATPase PilB-like protein
MESALTAVVSQRLVRKICDMCGETMYSVKHKMDLLQLTDEALVGLPIRRGFGVRSVEKPLFRPDGVFEIM